VGGRAEKAISFQLNPLHPTPTGDAWAGGLKKRFPFSDTLTGEIQKSAGANPYTTGIHELVHVYNWHQHRISRPVGGRTDEGMAYVAQAIVGGALQLVQIEQILNDAASNHALPQADRNRIDILWKEVWDDRLRDVEINRWTEMTAGWGFPIGNYWFGNQPRPLRRGPATADINDFVAVYTDLHAEANCWSVAQQLSGVGFCVHFSCDPTAGTFDTITPARRYDWGGE
jgi:hypothetical protein